jgi:hypothetical protein
MFSRQVGHELFECSLFRISGQAALTVKLFCWRRAVEGRELPRIRHWRQVGSEIGVIVSFPIVQKTVSSKLRQSEAGDDLQKFHEKVID